MLVGLAHVALIWPRYHVGSFDDDAGYILGAKALLAGEGLTGHLASGQVMVGLYPPGYPALLAPLLWIWPHDYDPVRLLSVACFAAVFPLTWIYLRRREVRAPVVAVILLVMGLGPAFATFASMVMAETPFLVALLVLLLVLDRWLPSAKVLGRWGLTAIAAAAGLIWLKQAGIGLVAGLILWLPLSRTPRRMAKAVALAAGVGLTIVPVVVARLTDGIPLAGARYSEELGGFYQGDLTSRLVHVLPQSTWHLFSTAIPATLVPYLDPLPLAGHWPDLWKVLSWQVTILVVVGAVAWARRYRDAAVAMTVVYLIESVLWPFVNERRSILLLPLLAAWYVMGAAAAWGRLRSLRLAPTAGIVVAATIVAAPLLAQAPRDYLFGWDQSSSEPAGARYTAVLAALAPKSTVVETDYQSAIALYTGHPTNWDAFRYNVPPICYVPGVFDEFRSDRAGFLVLGNLNKPGQTGSPCLAGLVPGASWAVPLVHTGRDSASVYELVGLDTAHPGLVNQLLGAGPLQLHSAGAESTWQWDWPAPVTLTQLSLGEAAVGGGPTAGVSLEVEGPGGQWSTVAASRSGVGDGNHFAPFLLASLPRPIRIVAVRVVVDGTGPGRPATVSDLAVIGPPAASSTRSR
jgi:hypothetical protein